jgi:hypothetical protein
VRCARAVIPVLCAVLLTQDGALTVPAEAPAPALVVRGLDLRPGDVVFISVPGAFWADLASRTSLPRYRHGHTGMIVRGGPAPQVVHASGNPVAADAVVVRVSLAEFTREAKRLDVFRPGDRAAAARAAREAESFAARRLSFDQEFSIDSRDSLYCTELIWRALSFGYGRDVIPQKHWVGGRAMIFMSDLETASVLARVETVTSELQQPGR